MKKKGLIIASLLILALSFVFLGCPPPEEEEETFVPVSDAAMKDLKEKIGYTDSLFPSPKCDYSTYKYDVDAQGYESIAIAWKDGDADKFAAYKEAWGDKIKTNSVSVARASYIEAAGGTLTLTDKDGKAFEKAFISLVGTAGDVNDNGLSVNAGDILFVIYK